MLKQNCISLIIFSKSNTFFLIIYLFNYLYVHVFVKKIFYFKITLWHLNKHPDFILKIVLLTHRKNVLLFLSRKLLQKKIEKVYFSFPFLFFIF